MTGHIVGVSQVAHRATRSFAGVVMENPVVPLAWWMISCLVVGQAMMEASEGVKQDLETRILPIARESSDPRLLSQVSGGAAFPALFLKVILTFIAIIIDGKYGYL